MRYQKFISLLARLVPPRREIILRSGGQVRYFGISRFGQIGVLFLIALVIGWIGFASTSYVITAMLVAERNVRVATSDRIIRSMQEEIDDLKRDIEKRDTSISERETENEEIEDKNEALRDQIANLEAERDRLSDARDERDRKLARLNEELTKTETGREGLSQQLDEAAERSKADQAEREKLVAQTEAANAQIESLKAEIAQLTGERDGLTAELDNTRGELKAAIDERTDAIAERGKLDERVAVLSGRLEQFEVSQAESIDRLGENTELGITALEQTLDIAGLDIPLMLERVLGESVERFEGVGGPLLAVADEPGAEAGDKLANVEQRLLRLQGLQGLMTRLPLAAPMDSYRLTSGFGRRRDPFTGQLAMHPGLDFASRTKIPVHVTAPGRAVFVGWRGGYGKVVEVDHGLGVRTRYAHLSQIYVKRGQKLEFREKLGLVGSTGRSTSTHLHYEILVDGQQLDPANFLRAGQYVYKN